MWQYFLPLGDVTSGNIGIKWVWFQSSSDVALSDVTSGSEGGRGLRTVVTCIHRGDVMLPGMKVGVVRINSDIKLTLGDVTSGSGLRA